MKTRLARTFGAEGTCALYRAFVLDLADRLTALPYRVTWAFEPAEAPFAELLPGARCRAQVGADLGERLAGVVSAAFAEAPGPVLVIGADAPHVPARRLAEAARVLAGGGDVVLGPAEDGGYYLIGLRAPSTDVFARIPWGTPAVLAATLERARVAGLRTELLAPEFDVDEPADVVRLARVVASGTAELPRTAEVLGRLIRSGP